MKQNSMRVIGITGGVGAGKSEILSYIKKNYCCKIVLADEVAHKVKEPGTPCYHALVQLLGKDVLSTDGTIDKVIMAQKIFSDKNILQKVNELIHPAVKKYIMAELNAEREKKELDYFFIEAALLIEEHYDEIVDELWYISTKEEVRRERLKMSRGYTDEKIDSIMKEQLREEEYKKHCKFMIDNSHSLETTYRQIYEKLGETL